jgi:hypothetical protein
MVRIDRAVSHSKRYSVRELEGSRESLDSFTQGQTLCGRRSHFCQTVLRKRQLGQSSRMWNVEDEVLKEDVDCSARME